MAGEFTIQVSRDGDVGTLSWDAAVTAEALEKAVSLAADDQLLGHGIRRLEAAVPLGDQVGRRALHRCGFRREGVRRQAMAVDDGFVDVALYARLATDVVYGPEGFSSVMDTVLPTKRVIAHVLFRNAAGQALLLRTSYKSDWELPGGVVEPGEPPRVGAQREVFEELGIDVVLDEPALVDWMPPYLGWSDAVEFIYDAGVLGDDALAGFTTDPVEIRSAHWVGPDELAERVTPLSERRIRLLLDGFRGATEAGVPVA